ncbi:MAG: hypothetical protein AAF532_02555 [Planctomycetota bacterium]
MSSLEKTYRPTFTSGGRRDRHVDDLVGHALDEAERLGLKFWLSRSETSEAAYVSVLRSGRWYGLRIAKHAPAYAASADAAQVLLPPRVPEQALPPWRELVRGMVRSGGEVVADPEEVEAAITDAIRRERRRRGRWKISNAETAAIRHRLHVRAKWTAEIEAESQLS